MQYAIIQTGGKQYQVELGQELQVELLHAEGLVTFDQVLLVVDGDKVEVGTPTVEGVVVTATVIGDVKGEKIDILRYKSKSRYRKHTGHRQKYTAIKIETIGKLTAPKKEAKAVKVVKEVKEPKVAKTEKKVVKKVTAKKTAAK